MGHRQRERERARAREHVPFVSVFVCVCVHLCGCVFMALLPGASESRYIAPWVMDTPGGRLQPVGRFGSIVSVIFCKPNITHFQRVS